MFKLGGVSRVGSGSLQIKGNFSKLKKKETRRNYVLMQASSGPMPYNDTFFQQVIEESQPISIDLRTTDPQQVVENNITATCNKEEKKQLKLDKKAKKKELKRQKMAMKGQCEEEDSDSDSDSDEEDEGCMEKGKNKKMKMKKTEMKDENDDCQKEDKQKKKNKKKMKMEKNEMEEKEEEVVDKEMVDRQQKLFDKVVDMWEADRKSWVEREQVLLDQIKLLQSLVGPQKESPKNIATYSEQENYEQGNMENDFVTNLEKSMSERTSENEDRITDTMPVKIPDTAEELARALGMVSDSDVLEDVQDYINMPRRGQKLPQKAQGTQYSTTRESSNPIAKEQQFQIEDEEIAAPVVKETPSGPPPVLSLGSDDIFWVNQLQAGLLTAGFYCGEEEMEDWYFGEQTQSALLTFQACSSIPETGTADEATWKTLLGDQLKPIVPSDNSSDSESEETNIGAKEVIMATAVKEEQIPIITKADKASLDWPVLMEGDGGKEVHSLQVALGRKGFYCGGEDTEWWQFGNSTLEALKTFQECNSLPVSGVSDANSWKALLGQNAAPEDVAKIKAGDDTDQDMSDQNGRIWLMGEQRWSDPSRLQVKME
eukprot:TRINITY_DN4086_c0_g1_i7.p1 TRINITY_DN4086_c0_g1~~TRINITY_DN4086_c0_g1_i7.p1  ORF type:complete len:633 (+),score=134.51 TRINITY_DN4086_c0_g1_i7:104-1900(+)